jgi:hypothetical protein
MIPFLGPPRPPSSKLRVLIDDSSPETRVYDLTPAEEEVKQCIASYVKANGRRWTQERDHEREMAKKESEPESAYDSDDSESCKFA